MSNESNSAVAEVQNEAADAVVISTQDIGVQMVPVADIIPSEVALRGVQDKTEEFQNLMDSIKKRGILNSILVCPLPNGKFSLVDGLQRFTCAQRLGLSEVPARVMEMEKRDILESQIITNIHRVKTKPADLAKQMLHLMSLDPTITVQEMARRMSNSTTWVNDTLSLNQLVPAAKDAVNSGRMNLSNAYMLARLPVENQDSEINAALEEPTLKFVPRIKDQLKAIRDAKNSGRDASKEWKPPVHLRAFGAVETEWNALQAGGESSVLTLIEASGVAVNEKVKAAVLMAIAWTLNQDPVSIENETAAHQARVKAREEKEAARKKEREAAKAEKSEAAKANTTLFD